MTEEQTIVLAADAVSFNPTAVLLYDNGILVAELTGGRPYHYRWTVTADDEGEHTWTAHARYSPNGTRSALPLVSNELLFDVDLGTPAPPREPHKFYNSAEPGCDGSDPTVLWCDDFEDGSWFVKDGHFDSADDDGWGGYLDDTADQLLDQTGNGNFAKCGGQGVAGTNCTAIKGANTLRSQGVEAAGWHRLVESPHVLKEFYIRWYFMPEGPNCNLSHEKLLGFGDYNTFGGSNSDFGFLDSAFNHNEPWMIPVAEDAWKEPNQGNTITFECGHWHYLEVHVNLGTQGSHNGTYQLWMDDCGTDGLRCTGPGTLRADHGGIDWYASQDNVNWVSFWFWAPQSGNPPPASSGDRRIDQIVAATRRIGPMGATR